MFSRDFTDAKLLSGREVTVLSVFWSNSTDKFNKREYVISTLSVECKRVLWFKKTGGRRHVFEEMDIALLPVVLSAAIRPANRRQL